MKYVGEALEFAHCKHEVSALGGMDF
jgi:hypothetical protein